MQTYLGQQVALTAQQADTILQLAAHMMLPASFAPQEGISSSQVAQPA
jgi:hypothetical protein